MKMSKLIQSICRKASKGKDTKELADELLAKVEGTVKTYSGKSKKEVKAIVKDTEIITPYGRVPVNTLDEVSLANLVAIGHKEIVGTVVSERTELTDLEAELVRAIATNKEFLAAVIALALYADDASGTDLI